jgi:hypothetical protein
MFMEGAVGGGSGRFTEGPRRRSGPSVRKVMIPLAVYHALILAGAFLVVRGNLLGSSPSVFSGALLIAGGIAVEVAILYWAAELIRRSAVAQGGPVPVVPSRPPSVRPPRSLCWGCGWQGDRERSYCPRCGKLVVRVAG